MLNVTTCLKLQITSSTLQRDKMNNEREFSLLDERNEPLVRRDRGRAGGETEDELLVCSRCEIVYAAEEIWVRESKYRDLERQTASQCK